MVAVSKGGHYQEGPIKLHTYGFYMERRLLTLHLLVRSLMLSTSVTMTVFIA